ncbi:MAG: antibiotic biosynthesis monooxygenase [Chlorobiaceae bacterium]|nr:antibiotic biosynthesis monooxygenase [Chlorobiaceae bacterium]
MSQLTVIATVVAEKESAEQLKSELLKLVAPTRQEEGCISYTLHQDNEDPAVFIFHETWQSPVHLERHIASEHYRAYASAAEGLIAGKAVNKLTLIG